MWVGPPEHPVALIGVGLVTPGENFSCDNDLADRLIEQGRATLVDDNGRTVDGILEPADTPPANTQSDAIAPPADVGMTPRKSQSMLEAVVAADAAALATAEAEAATAPPLPETA